MAPEGFPHGFAIFAFLEDTEPTIFLDLDPGHFDNLRRQKTKSPTVPPMADNRTHTKMQIIRLCQLTIIVDFFSLSRGRFFPSLVQISTKFFLYAFLLMLVLVESHRRRRKRLSYYHSNWRKT